MYNIIIQILKGVEFMRIGICDDDIEYVKDIKQRILRMNDEDVELNIDAFVNQNALLEKAKTKKYDLIYLDIEMDGKNGIQIADEIKKITPTSIIVFVTNYQSYVSNAFRVGAFQYLTKPIDDAYFREEFKRIVEKYKTMNRIRIFKMKDGKETFVLDEIIAVESYYNTAKLRTTRGMFYTNYVNLRKIRKEIMEYDFVKLQASYIVNMNYISAIRYREAILITGQKIAISSTCYNKVLEKYYKFIDRKKW
jgi:two-component system response regulator LytT